MKNYDVTYKQAVNVSNRLSELVNTYHKQKLKVQEQNVYNRDFSQILLRDALFVDIKILSAEKRRIKNCYLSSFVNSTLPCTPSLVEYVAKTLAFSDGFAIKPIQFQDIVKMPSKYHPDKKVLQGAVSMLRDISKKTLSCEISANPEWNNHFTCSNDKWRVMFSMGDESKKENDYLIVSMGDDQYFPDQIETVFEISPYELSAHERVYLSEIHELSKKIYAQTNEKRL